MGNVVSLASKANDGLYIDPAGCLREAQEAIEEKVGAFAEGKKLIILCLDDSDEGYHVTSRYCGMKRSEIVSLLEYARADMVREMLPPR